MHRSWSRYRRRVSLIALFLLLAPPSALAVPLPPGDTALSGTTVAERPELAGVVEADMLVPYSFQGAGSSVSGVIQNRVVRAVDGTIDFIWRIIPDTSSNGDITAFRLGRFGGFALDADFRLDGLGSVGPDIARNFGGGFVDFLFNDGVNGDAGESSFFYFLDTQATAFSNTAFYHLLCAPLDCVSPPFATFAPAQPPPPNALPTASGVLISGTPQVGQQLTGSYTRLLQLGLSR
jgi:hypothetical protein